MTPTPTPERLFQPPIHQARWIHTKSQDARRTIVCVTDRLRIGGVSTVSCSLCLYYSPCLAFSACLLVALWPVDLWPVYLT
jgi:hypothetical protein